MTIQYTRYDRQKEHPKPGGGDAGSIREGAKPGRTILLTGDPFGWLISLHPILVALMFIGAGWGTLLLIAWRLEVIESQFLSNPAFMVGDLALLPLLGALIAFFYRSASLAMPWEWGLRITIGSATLASIAAGATAAFSIFLTENYEGLWSVPHTLFIWFFAYTLISFLPRAVSEIVFYMSVRKLYLLMAVMCLPVAHMTLKANLGGSLG